MTEIIYEEIEHCFVNVWRLFNYELPRLECTPSYKQVIDTTGIVEFNYPEWTGVYMLFYFAVSIFGVAFVELLNNKFLWLIEPITSRVEKRLAYVKERDRLLTYNFRHP